MRKVFLEDELFIVFINYLTVYLNSGFNLFLALSEVEKLLQAPIKDEIKSLIEQIKGDKTVGPYHRFSMKFKNQLIAQIMTLLFQNNKVGKTSNSLDNLIPILERLKMQVIEDRIKREQQLLNNYLLSPIFGVTLISIYFSTGILAVLVGNIYG